MVTKCLNCGEVLHDRSAIRFAVGEPRRTPSVRLEEDGGQLFVRCGACHKRNYFIKNYAFSTVVLRVCHVEGTTAAAN